MTYRIGTIAKLLGMSAEGIRMYERSGILRAQRENEENEYRSFDHLDITALIRARGYHYCGFSTREIARLINSPDVEEVTELYARKEEELRREIVHKQLQMKCLEEFRQLTEKAEEQLFQISVRQRPALYRFEFLRDGKLLLKEESEKIFRTWVRMTPMVFLSQMNSWEKLVQGETQVTAALGILAEAAGELELDISYAKYYEKCPCLYTVVKEQGNQFCPARCLAHVVEYVKEKGIPVTGNPIARTFLSMNKRDDYTRYRQVWIPIETGEGDYESSLMP